MDQQQYKSTYGETCDCPYCGETQRVEVDLDSNAWDKEIDCDDCGGKFKYNLEVTIDFACHPIEGEGPRDENGNEKPGPRFIDPNQINLLNLVEEG